jgi:hypothetical protein
LVRFNRKLFASQNDETQGPKLFKKKESHDESRHNKLGHKAHKENPVSAAASSSDVDSDYGEELEEGEEVSSSDEFDSDSDFEPKQLNM